MEKIIRQAIFYLMLLLIWQIISWLRFWPEYLFPPPKEVFFVFFQGLKDSTYIIAILISMKRVLIGYGLSIIIGVLLGVLINKYKFIEETIGGLILGIQTLPSVCWLPLSLLWFGLNERAIIFVVIMGALFSITIAVNSGIKNISPIYIKAGKNLGAKKIYLLFFVVFPAALPFIVSGLKQGWSFAWRSLIAGEMLFMSLGLGYLLNRGRELNDLSQVIAVMLVISFISILMDKLVFALFESNMKRKWGLMRSI